MPVAAAGTPAGVHVRLAEGAAQSRSTELRAGQSCTQFRREGLDDAGVSSLGRAVLTAVESGRASPPPSLWMLMIPHLLPMLAVVLYASLVLRFLFAILSTYSDRKSVV